MTKTCMTDWFHYKNREVTVFLPRIRTGNNYPNSSNHSVDREVDSRYRKGCEAIENAKHILIDCPPT